MNEGLRVLETEGKVRGSDVDIRSQFHRRRFSSRYTQRLCA